MAFTGERNSEGKFDGQGAYSFADGATDTGEWKDNQPNGQGSETDKLGATTYIGLFKNGKHAVATAVALVPATATPAIAKPANTMAAPAEAPVVAPTAAATVPTPTATAMPAPTQPPAAKRNHISGYWSSHARD